ncbi:hypothetical protein [Leptotrichia trevisanii]|uniref:hypothetical protein n=1 Tax=Leptotrichia trevisanii TaxID=109328 RepID=UPI0026EF97A1|nr:hypothetical protein [Leptotrichia trevisanii]
MENNNIENKNLVKILIGIIIALVLVIGFIIIGGGIYQFVSMKNKISEMEKVQKEQEKKQLENQMMASVQTQAKENNKKSETKTNETKEVDPYERRFTASDMNDTLVEIKGVRDGNKVLVRVLEGKNKNKKGYINLKGFKNISSSSLRKLIGSTWAATGVNNGVEMEYGLILHRPGSDIYSFNLNKALIDYKLSGHDSAVRYDCERDTARNFVQNYDPSACY